MGIDIGGLDLCILSGHPGTFASFWQQAGRVGRQGKAALIVYIAKDTPIDQYLVHHPEFIGQAPIERAWLSAENPYIMLQPLPCAAYEHPLRSDESLYQSTAYTQALAAAGAVMKVDPGHIAMFEPTVTYDITRVKGLKNIFFSGEGLFLASLTGSSPIILSALMKPIMKMNNLSGLFRAPYREISLQRDTAPGRISWLHGMSPVLGA